MLATGTIIAGKYEVESTLGSGGMATVYLVRHLTLEARFALKVSHAHSPGLLQRFVLEGQLQARLHHPGVVKVQDIIDVHGAPGLIMEYVAGGNLDTWCQVRPLHALDEVRRLYRALVEAVGAAHSAEIVHRDLKPANVLLTGDPAAPMPRVTDFGIAKVLDSASSPTRSNMGFGTVAYMAPEQAYDARSVDKRADIFALGCILYEMITGERAYPEYNPAMDEETRRRDMDPRKVRPETPEALAQAVVRCLRFRREERPQSCKELLVLLDGGSISGGVGATPVPITRPDAGHTLPIDLLGEPLPPVDAGNPWLLPGILVGITALLAVGLGFRLQEPEPPPEPVPTLTSVVRGPEQPKGESTGAGEANGSTPAEPPIGSPPPPVGPRPKKAENPKPPPPEEPPGEVLISSKPMSPFTFRGKSYKADFHRLSAPPGDHLITYVGPDGVSKSISVEVKSGKEVGACWDFNINDPCL
jgi:serine/threonine-protein kinase